MKKKSSVVLKVVIGILILLILILIYFILRPTTVADKENIGDESLIELRNIIIEDFDEYGMGLMHDGKYYAVQYGVHVKDDSFIGEHLGKTSRSNELINVEGNTYEYVENASYCIDDNSDFYEYNGEEDVILVDAGMDDTWNQLWVLSPELLPKTSLYDFWARDDLKITFYPNSEDTLCGYELSAEEVSEFTSSFKRIADPSARFTQEGYVIFDDCSGLTYGAIVYYDTENCDCYLVPPSFPKVVIQGGETLSKYIGRYAADKHERDVKYELDLFYGLDN